MGTQISMVAKGAAKLDLYSIDLHSLHFSLLFFLGSTPYGFKLLSALIFFLTFDFFPLIKNINSDMEKY
jgi:hypothetical protein